MTRKHLFTRNFSLLAFSGLSAILLAPDPAFAADRHGFATTPSVETNLNALNALRSANPFAPAEYSAQGMASGIPSRMVWQEGPKGIPQPSAPAAEAKPVPAKPAAKAKPKPQKKTSEVKAAPNTQKPLPLPVPATDSAPVALSESPPRPVVPAPVETPMPMPREEKPPVPAAPKQEQSPAIPKKSAESSPSFGNGPQLLGHATENTGSEIPPAKKNAASREDISAAAKQAAKDALQKQKPPENTPPASASVAMEKPADTTIAGKPGMLDNMKSWFAAKTAPEAAPPSGSEVTEKLKSAQEAAENVKPNTPPALPVPVTIEPPTQPNAAAPVEPTMPSPPRAAPPIAETVPVAPEPAAPEPAAPMPAAPVPAAPVPSAPRTMVQKPAVVESPLPSAMENEKTVRPDTSNTPAPAMPVASTENRTPVAEAAKTPVKPDQQQASLNEPAAATNLTAQALYNGNDTELPGETKQALNSIAQKLKTDSGLRVSIVAHATGTADQPSTARRISLARALAARAYLIDQGVDTLRINVQAEGAKNAGDRPDRLDIFVMAPSKG